MPSFSPPPTIMISKILKTHWSKRTSVYPSQTSDGRPQASMLLPYSVISSVLCGEKRAWSTVELLQAKQKQMSINFCVHALSSPSFPPYHIGRYTQCLSSVFPQSYKALYHTW